MSGKLRKRSTLKSKKDLMHKSQGSFLPENISKIVGIYSHTNRSHLRPDSANGTIKYGGGQMFLNSLRQLSKLSLENA